jgi:hypothetical protein
MRETRGEEIANICVVLTVEIGHVSGASIAGSSISCTILPPKYSD